MATFLKTKQIAKALSEILQAPLQFTTVYHSPTDTIFGIFIVNSEPFVWLNYSAAQLFKTEDEIKNTLLQDISNIVPIASQDWEKICNDVHLALKD